MEIQFCGNAMWKGSLSRERLARAADVLQDEGLELMATNDVFWDEVVSIESAGNRRSSTPRSSERTISWRTA